MPGSGVTGHAVAAVRWVTADVVVGCRMAVRAAVRREVAGRRAWRGRWVGRRADRGVAGRRDDRRLATRLARRHLAGRPAGRLVMARRAGRCLRAGVSGGGCPGAARGRCGRGAGRCRRRPGGLQGAGQGGDPGHGRRRMRSREARPGQRRGPLVIGIQADPSPPFSRLAAVLGALRVGDDDGLAQAGAELGVGQLSRFGQDVVLDGSGGVLIEEAGRLGDQPGPVSVDLAGGEGGAGGGQPPGQGHGLAGPPLRRPRRQRQGQRHLRGGVGSDRSRAAVFLQAGLLVPGRGPGGDLGDGGELPGLGPRRDPPPPGRHGRQVKVAGLSGVALVQPRGQARTARQVLRHHIQPQAALVREQHTARPAGGGVRVLAARVAGG